MRQRFLQAAVLTVLFNGAVFAETPLSTGVTFPDLVGKTLSGSNVVVGNKDGLPKVLVIAFTKDAIDPARAWLDACRADPSAQPGASPGPVVSCYDVRMVTALPPVVRGFVEGRMRKGVKARDLANVILVSKDKEDWRDRLTVMADFENDPFVIVVDRDGRVQSLLRGPFNATALKTEQAKLVAR